MMIDEFACLIGGSMPNGRFTAGVRLVLRSALLVSSLLGTNVQLRAQLHFCKAYDSGICLTRSFGYSIDTTAGFRPPPPIGPVETISSDVLGNPISSKALRMLQKAMHRAELGEHSAAIQALYDTLLKQPAAAPYVHGLLGIEYLETHQLAAALTAFEETVRLMPHDSGAHSNFGLLLAATGQLDRAEGELRKALALDRTNAKAKTILEVVLVARRAPRAAAVAAGLTP